MTTHTNQPTVNDYLSSQITVGEPDVSGSLAVFPLFGPEPNQQYVSFAEGRDRGVVVKELDSGASIGDLLVGNPTGEPVLLFEGEEVLGAQQNRVFDISVLIAAWSKLRVPVSCVEVGRWDHSRHADTFAPAPQTAYPDLRRAKNRQARERVAAGVEARADQTEVWQHIGAKSVAHDVRSRTGAMHDIYESRRDLLARFADAVHLREHQLGMLVAIGGRFSVLDYVSRPEVMAVLHDPLVQGYALDALGAEECEPPTSEDASGFVTLVTGSRASERDGIGLGRDVRFVENGVSGSGLVTGEELVQLTAFPEDGEHPAPTSTRGAGHVRRPSRRRR